MENIIWVVLLCAVLALLFAAWKTSAVSKADAGTERMKEIAGNISDGARAFLFAEYKILVIFVAVLFVLIPLSLVVTMIDVQQGSPQNFNEYETVQLLEPVGVTADGSIVDADDPAAVETIDQATVPMGPQASQVAIKQLGTNGGGFLGATA